MYIDIFILALLIGSILGLSVAILFIVGVYSRMNKKIEETENEKILLHNNITKKAQDLLQEAHANNVKIISDANKQAAQIIAEAKQSKTSSEDILSQKLDQLLTMQGQTFEKISSDVLKSYQTSITQLQAQDLEQIKKVSGAIEQSAEKQLSDFQTTLAHETVDIEKNVKEQVEKKLAQTDAEIQAYKDAQFEKVRNEMYPLLQRITEEALGKSLSIQDHEDLIQQALEEARPKVQQNTSIPTKEEQKTPQQTQAHA